jgi:hypothetical protein
MCDVIILTSGIIEYDRLKVANAHKSPLGTKARLALVVLILRKTTSATFFRGFAFTIVATVSDHGRCIAIKVCTGFSRTCNDSSTISMISPSVRPSGHLNSKFTTIEGFWVQFLHKS